MRNLVVLVLLFGSFSLAKAQDSLSGRFIKALVQGSNRFSVRAASAISGTTFSNAEEHSFSGEIGYGWFRKGNRSLYGGFGVSVSQLHSRPQAYWSNSFSGVLELSNYRSLYGKHLYFSLARSIQYTYHYQRHYGVPSLVPVPNPVTEDHTGSIRLKPGILYRYNPAVLFQLNLELLNVMVTTSKTYDYAPSHSSTTRYTYNLFSGYSLSALQVAMLWSPGFLQKKSRQL